jgi:hypothetical protein
MSYTAATDDRDIARYWMLRHYPRVLRWRQTGGGHRYILNVDGKHPIEYNVSEDGYSIFIRGGHKPLVSPCFVLEIDPSNPTMARLQEVERRNGHCFRDGHADSRNIVRAAATIAIRRHIKTLQFTDNSYILCPEVVNLADLSFLTTGRTWYESILPNLQCVSPICKNLDTFRQLVRTNTWRQVGHDLIDLTFTNSTTINIDAPGSAMAVLNAMKLDRGFCWFFEEYMGRLIGRSGIESLTGKHWICSLPSLPSRRTTRRQTSRNHRRSTQKRPR